MDAPDFFQDAAPRQSVYLEAEIESLALYWLQNDPSRALIRLESLVRRLKGLDFTDLQAA